jgi:hypothetical protein
MNEINSKAATEVTESIENCKSKSDPGLVFSVNSVSSVAKRF